MVDNAWLTKNRFSSFCRISRNNDLTTLAIEVVEGAAPNTKSSVYLWLHPIEGQQGHFTVLYAGKAGRGVSARLRQHKAGFDAADQDTGKARQLIDLLDQKKIQVWSRTSDTTELFGVQINNYSAEEHALIIKFRPLLNYALPPDAVAPQGDPAPAAAGNAAPAPNNPTLNLTLTEKSYEDYKRIIMPELTEHGTVPAQVAVSNALCSLEENPAFKGILTKIFIWLDDNAILGVFDVNPIGAHNDQPGLNGTPLISFGIRAPAGHLNNGIARVFFHPTNGPQLVLPANIVNDGAKTDCIGNEAGLRPNNMEDFLIDPDRYINADALNQAIRKRLGVA